VVTNETDLMKIRALWGHREQIFRERWWSSTLRCGFLLEQPLAVTYLIYDTLYFSQSLN